MKVICKGNFQVAYFIVGAQYKPLGLVYDAVNRKGEKAIDKNGDAIPAIALQEIVNGVQTRKVYIFPRTLTTTVELVAVNPDGLTVHTIVTSETNSAGQMYAYTGTFAEKVQNELSATFDDIKDEATGETKEKGEELWAKAMMQLMPNGFQCNEFNPHKVPEILIRGWGRENGVSFPSYFYKHAQHGFDGYKLDLL